MKRLVPETCRRVQPRLMKHRVLRHPEGLAPAPAAEAIQTNQSPATHHSRIARWPPAAAPNLASRSAEPTSWEGPPPTSCAPVEGSERAPRRVREGSRTGPPPTHSRTRLQRGRDELLDKRRQRREAYAKPPGRLREGCALPRQRRRRREAEVGQVSRRGLLDSDVLQRRDDPLRLGLWGGSEDGPKRRDLAMARPPPPPPARPGRRRSAFAAGAAPANTNTRKGLALRLVPRHTAGDTGL